MPRERFEPTTPVFEWAKIVHALDRTNTVNGSRIMYMQEMWTETRIILPRTLSVPSFGRECDEHLRFCNPMSPVVVWVLGETVTSSQGWGHVPCLRHYIDICLQEQRNAIKILSQGSVSPDWYLNALPWVHEAEVITKLFLLQQINVVFCFLFSVSSWSDLGIQDRSHKES
jgi:hypothetical protein